MTTNSEEKPRRNVEYRYGDIPKSSEPVRSLPAYEWLPDATKLEIEGFTRRRQSMLEARCDALDKLEECKRHVEEGTFTARTVTAGEKARAALLVADAMEIPLCDEWRRLHQQIQADSRTVIANITEQIKAREDDIEKAGIAAGEAEAVRDAKIQTDAKIAELCESAPPRIDNNGEMNAILSERAENLRAKLDKYFSV